MAWYFIVDTYIDENKRRGEYRAIMDKRTNRVDSRALIAEGLE